MEIQNCYLVRSDYRIPSDSSVSVLSCPFKPDYSLIGKSSGEISDTLSVDGLTGVTLSIASSIADIFVNCINIGDILIVSNRNTYEIISLVRVVGNYGFDDRVRVHTRQVKFLHSIPRTSLPKPFRDSVLRTPRLIAKIPFDTVVQSLLDKSVLDKPSALAVKFPLRPDFSIEFSIPSNMTVIESERLSAFVKTLYQQENEA